MKADTTTSSHITTTLPKSQSQSNDSMTGNDQHSGIVHNNKNQHHNIDINHTDYNNELTTDIEDNNDVTQVDNTSTWWQKTKNTVHSVRQSPTTVLAVASGALFVDLLVYSIIIPVIPLYIQQHFHTGSTIIGVIFAMFSVGLVLSTPIFGVLSDIPSIGRRMPMLMGLLGMIASTILYGLATELWLLFLARFFQGVSSAASWVVGMAMVADVYDANVLGSKLGILMSINGIGLLIGPTLGGVIYENVSYISIFIICAAVVAADLAARIILIDESMIQAHITAQHQMNIAVIHNNNTDHVTSSDNDIGNNNVDVDHSIVTIDNNTTVDNDTTVTHIKQNKYTIWHMMIDKEIMLSTIGVLLLSAVFSAIEPILALYFNDRFGLSSQMIGVIYLALVIPYMISSILTGYLVDMNIRKKLILAIGSLLLSVAFPLLGYSGTIWSVILSLVFLGTAIGVAMTPTLPEVSEYLQTMGRITAQAQGYALFNLAWAGGALIGGILSGILYQTIGWFYAMLLFGMICAGYGIIAILYCIVVPDVLAIHRKRKKLYHEQQKQSIDQPITSSPDIDANTDNSIIRNNNNNSINHVITLSSSSNNVMLQNDVDTSDHFSAVN